MSKYNHVAADLSRRIGSRHMVVAARWLSIRAGEVIDLTGLPWAKVDDLVADANKEQASEYGDRLFCNQNSRDR